ncbi:MAG TPA: hypothetical protein VF627_12760 [Abditibacterium sp.]|jgi:hypothetical protein
MSAMAIGMGLTQIRRYHFAHPGFFYGGLLSFVSGVERLAKLILLYDYRLDNSNSYPTDRFLKDIGHKITDLITKAREINTKRGFANDESILDDEILKRMIVFLTDFATQSRYYNLDYLSGRVQPHDEPLARWDNEIASLIVQRHHRSTVERQELQNQMADLLKEFAWVQHTAEDGSEINSMAGMLQHSELIPVKQRYSMFYLYQIAHFLSELLSDLEFTGGFNPCLREFFMLYQNDDRAYILRKKSWNPVSPFHF